MSDAGRPLRGASAGEPGSRRDRHRSSRLVGTAFGHGEGLDGSRAEGGNRLRLSRRRQGRGPSNRLLTAKTALVFHTSDTPEERERAVFGDPLERSCRDCVFGFCGVRDTRRKRFRVIADSSLADRALWLREVEDMGQAAFPRYSSF